MNIGIGTMILLYGALAAMLIVNVFIVIGMVWLNNRVERLSSLYGEMFTMIEQR